MFSMYDAETRNIERLKAILEVVHGHLGNQWSICATCKDLNHCCRVIGRCRDWKRYMYTIKGAYYRGLDGDDGFVSGLLQNYE